MPDPRLTERGQGWNPRPQVYQLDSFPVCHNGNSRSVFVFEIEEKADFIEKLEVKFKATQQVLIKYHYVCVHMYFYLFCVYMYLCIFINADKIIMWIKS